MSGFWEAGGKTDQELNKENWLSNNGEVTIHCPKRGKEVK